jgi:hypothetical protein
MTKSAYQLRKEKQSDKVIGVIVGGIIGVILAALLFQFAWNVGVVGLAVAVGASVAGISFWTALGGLVVLLFVRGALAVVGSKSRD